MNKSIIILYHADCPDGFGAAWAARKKFGDEAEYIGVHHESPPPDGLEGKEIYTLDFTYPLEITKDLIAKNKRVTSIDHHVSVEGAIELTKDYLYDNNHSGAVLSWTYFHKGRNTPKMLEYIEDRDLYRFNIKETKAVCAFIDSYDYDFKVWDKLAEDIQDDKIRVDCISKGEVIVKYEEELVKHFIDENARLCDFEGHQTYVVNAPHEFASQVGAILYKKNPPIAVIWNEDKERVNVSLRSDGTVDVSQIATKFGGGGHKESSGFRLESITSFPWKEKNI